MCMNCSHYLALAQLTMSVPLLQGPSRTAGRLCGRLRATTTSAGDCTGDDFAAASLRRRRTQGRVRLRRIWSQRATVTERGQRAVGGEASAGGDVTQPPWTQGAGPWVPGHNGVQRRVRILCLTSTAWLISAAAIDRGDARDTVRVSGDRVGLVELMDPRLCLTSTAWLTSAAANCKAASLSLHWHGSSYSLLRRGGSEGRIAEDLHRPPAVQRLAIN
jgi:hypothetical protein